MLGVKRMPRPFSESRKPESRRKIAVWRGMRMRLIDSPPDFPGQPCACGEREGPSPLGWEGEGQTHALLFRRLQCMLDDVAVGAEPVGFLDELAALNLEDLHPAAAFVVGRRDLQRRDEAAEGEVADL